MSNLTNEVIAIVPARSGSKGVPDKNIRELDGYPLLSLSIAAAKLAGINKVWVSTDSEKYARIAVRFGAEVPFLRSQKISTDTSSDYEFMLHAMNWHKNEFKSIPQYWVHLRPTTPLRDPKIIQEAVRIITENDSLDSLRSAHEVSESPFKWFLKDENNMFQGLREDLTPEKVNEPRQNFPKVYNPNGYVDIVKSSVVLNSGCLHGHNMYVFETPHCQEIDNADDFEYLEFKFEKEGSILNDYLDNF